MSEETKQPKLKIVPELKIAYVIEKGIAMHKDVQHSRWIKVNVKDHHISVTNFRNRKTWVSPMDVYVAGQIIEDLIKTKAK